MTFNDLETEYGNNPVKKKHPASTTGLLIIGILGRNWHFANNEIYHLQALILPPHYSGPVDHVDPHKSICPRWSTCSVQHVIGKYIYIYVSICMHIHYVYIPPSNIIWILCYQVVYIYTEISVRINHIY